MVDRVGEVLQGLLAHDLFGQVEQLVAFLEEVVCDFAEELLAVADDVCEQLEAFDLELHGPRAAELLEDLFGHHRQVESLEEHPEVVVNLRLGLPEVFDFEYVVVERYLVEQTRLAGVSDLDELEGVVDCQVEGVDQGVSLAHEREEVPDQQTDPRSVGASDRVLGESLHLFELEIDGFWVDAELLAVFHASAGARGPASHPRLLEVHV